VDNLVPVAIIAGLILLNAVFVAAEFAIVGAPRSTIDQLASTGKVSARIVQAILRDPRRQDRFIATAQLGITVASLGLGMYGEHVLADRLVPLVEPLTVGRLITVHAIASTLAIAMLTFFHIVIGEMVPKSIALQAAESAALWIAPPMRWVELAVYPIVVALNATGNGVLHLFGIRRQAAGTEHYYTPEELQLIVEESEESGALRGDAGRMLLELFEFGDLTAGEAMVPRVRVVGIPSDATPDDLRDILKSAPHTRYPVFEQDLDHVIGTIHIKEVLRAMAGNLPLPVDHLRPLPLVPETAQLDDVLTVMRRERSQMALILDEHGGTAGIISLEDLFEEVVGDIEESASAVPDIRPEGSTRVRVRGTVRISEVGQRFDLDLEHTDVDSVSGLILMLLGRVPRVGDSVLFGRLEFKVTRVKGRGVDEALVTLAPE
jgi:CBS domain containing-hemolysin-like protein